MQRRSVFLFALFAAVSLAGFLAGWLFREGPSLRAFGVLALTLAVSLVAGALARPAEPARR